MVLQKPPTNSEVPLLQTVVNVIMSSTQAKEIRADRCDRVLYFKREGKQGKYVSVYFLSPRKLYSTMLGKDGVKFIWSSTRCKEKTPDAEANTGGSLSLYLESMHQQLLEVEYPTFSDNMRPNLLPILEDPTPLEIFHLDANGQLGEMEVWKPASDKPLITGL